jgi:hypothetical protein
MTSTHHTAYQAKLQKQTTLSLFTVRPGSSCICILQIKEATVHSKANKSSPPPAQFQAVKITVYLAIVILNWHLLWVSHKIWWDVTTIKLHSLHYIQAILSTLPFFQCDNTLAAHFAHSLSNHLPYFLIVASTYSCNICQFTLLNLINPPSPCKRKKPWLSPSLSL